MLMLREANILCVAACMTEHFLVSACVCQSVSSAVVSPPTSPHVRTEHTVFLTVHVPLIPSFISLSPPPSIHRTMLLRKGETQYVDNLLAQFNILKEPVSRNRRHRRTRSVLELGTPCATVLLFCLSLPPSPPSNPSRVVPYAPPPLLATRSVREERASSLSQTSRRTSTSACCTSCSTTGPKTWTLCSRPCECIRTT